MMPVLDTSKADTIYFEHRQPNIDLSIKLMAEASSPMQILVLAPIVRIPNSV